MNTKLSCYLLLGDSKTASCSQAPFLGKVGQARHAPNVQNRMIVKQLFGESTVYPIIIPLCELMVISLSFNLKEQRFKKIQELENLLNATRRDAEEATNRHSRALWLAKNVTKKELKSVWKAVNTIQSSLEEKLMKVKDNFTEQEQHLKRMQDLESLFNSTRQDVKKATQQYLTELWSAENATNKEFQRMWTTVNATQVGLEKKIMKAKHNLTEQERKVQENHNRLGQLDNQIASLWNATNFTIIQVNASVKNVQKEMNATVERTSNLTDKVINEMEDIWFNLNLSRKCCRNLTSSLQFFRASVNNISKLAGPVGPPGFNGSQGPAGPAGSDGSRGPKGAGDFSACQYKLVTETPTPGANDALAGVNEPSGKRVLGVSCSTNYAAEYNLLSIVHNNKRRYTCSCKGNSALFSPTWGQPRNCFLYYWECPLTT